VLLLLPLILLLLLYEWFVLWLLATLQILGYLSLFQLLLSKVQPFLISLPVCW
jgi:hypothetical protein